MTIETFKWYKKPSHLSDDFFFIYKMRPPWEHDIVRYVPQDESWVKENLGFIYTEPYQQKVNVPEKALRRLITGTFEWNWFK
jgi:hypothetical protein